ncbi:MAG: nucleotidyl transferase AbiEii/AbiGii toxin family protein [Solirubrobacterales bacterium]
MPESAEPALVEKVTLSHGALEGAGIGHAFGGALALAYYGEPRVTVDIDLNIFGEVDQLDAVLDVFQPLGADEDFDRVGAERDGQVRIWWGRNPVDLFFSYDPFHDAMEEAARWVTFGKGRIPILSPEHLMVCKVVFDRPKDWVDIGQILLGEANLDESEIFKWLELILDPDDGRIIRMRELWARIR